MNDNLERAATTATSLDAEQDRGNIFKTQSKATPNEPGSQRTSLGGGPMCQEAMRDIVAQTRRVKKLERRKRLKTHGLKRLYKVRLSARVKSSEDEGLGEEDASQHGRIADIDANEDIILVSTHDEHMFDADQDLGGEEDDVQEKIDADYQLAERLQAEEQQELNDEEKAKLFMQLLEKRRKFFATKRAEEKRNKPLTLAQQRKIMCTYLKNMEGKKLTDLKNKSFDSIKKMFDRAFKRKIDDDKDTSKLQQLVKIIPDEEEVAINAIPLAVKPPSIVDWKIQKKRKKSYYKIIRANRSSKIYLIFSYMLKDFDREDVETLWELVKAKYGLTRPEGEYERVLCGDLKDMFEPHIDDEV
uniref:Uncharacterized protein n=1 Tax=Tanacetum cinerariifolium TaxID=118510 RepID=A0A699HWB1_TANCI|nr:hypothetical protein [Tanacetum cinerariifolium]